MRLQVAFICLFCLGLNTQALAQSTVNPKGGFFDDAPGDPRSFFTEEPKKERAPEEPITSPEVTEARTKRSVESRPVEIKERAASTPSPFQREMQKNPRNRALLQRMQDDKRSPRSESILNTITSVIDQTRALSSQAVKTPTPKSKRVTRPKVTASPVPAAKPAESESAKKNESAASGKAVNLKDDPLFRRMDRAFKKLEASSVSRPENESMGAKKKRLAQPSGNQSLSSTRKLSPRMPRSSGNKPLFANLNLASVKGFIEKLQEAASPVDAYGNPVRKDNAHATPPKSAASRSRAELIEKIRFINAAGDAALAEREKRRQERLNDPNRPKPVKVGGRQTEERRPQKMKGFGEEKRGPLLAEQPPPEVEALDSNPIAGTLSRSMPSNPNKVTTLSLVVSSVPHAAFAEAVDTLISLIKRPHIELGDIVVTGYTEAAKDFPVLKYLPQSLKEHMRVYNSLASSLHTFRGRRDVEQLMEKWQSLDYSVRPSDVKKSFARAPLPSTIEKLTRLSNGHSRAINFKKVFDRFSVNYSPSWVARFQGVDYVFEGTRKISRHFDEKGVLQDIEEDPKWKAPIGYFEALLENRFVPVKQLAHSKGNTFVFSELEGSKRQEAALFPRPTGRILMRSKTRKAGHRRLPLLQACRQSRVRRLRLNSVSPRAPSVNRVFYSALDPEQERLAAEHDGKTTKYHPGLEYKPGDLSFDKLQLLAVTLNIKCLPTMIRVALVEKTPVMEFREGEFAWKTLEEVEADRAH